MKQRRASTHTRFQVRTADRRLRSMTGRSIADARRRTDARARMVAIRYVLGQTIGSTGSCFRRRAGHDSIVYLDETVRPQIHAEVVPIMISLTNIGRNGEQLVIRFAVPAHLATLWRACKAGGNGLRNETRIAAVLARSTPSGYRLEMPGSRVTLLGPRLGITVLRNTDESDMRGGITSQQLSKETLPAVDRDDLTGPAERCIGVCSAG